MPPTLKDADRAALLRAMYQPETKPVPAPATPRPFDVNADRRSRMIAVGAIRYEVPSLEYVTGLERQLNIAKQMIEDQARMLKRMEAALQQVHQIMRKHGRDITDVSGSLANKIDRRD